ncbi:MAG: pyridoxal phosphate-dependent aminotransferase family protein [Deltaproteobacteria bacterium]|nr:pyridoxal phosphate-dependent aminotransferase family protein [Deltaproteobacteria bacterium]
MARHLQDTFIQPGEGDQRDPLLAVLRESKQYNVRIVSAKGRVLTDASGHQLFDFASCNYISFDQEQEALLEAGVRAVKQYGLHTSRARLMGYHELFSEVEAKLARFIGVEDTLLFPNTTLLGVGTIPALMKKGDLIVLDKSAHATMYQAAQLARDKGTILASYRQDHFDQLEHLLERHQDAKRKLICVDGVYSMTGDYAALAELAPLAKRYGALLYVDDGHGFAFLGERPAAAMPYGFSGNGVVKHAGLSYDNVMYVAGTAKGLAGAAAFLSVTPEMKEYLMAYAKPLDYTHPSTPYAMGVLSAALDLQPKVGDERRAKVYQLTKRLVEGLRGMGFFVMTKTLFPIISIWAGNTEKLIDASRRLYDQGIFLTSCPYPTMPRGKEALRVTVTSNNEVAQIDHLLDCLSQVATSWRQAGIPLEPTPEQRAAL